MTTELEPCPCCQSASVYLSWVDNDHPFAMVSCDGCGLCMEKGGGHWQRQYLEDEAATAWNTRPSAVPIGDEADWVRAARDEAVRALEVILGHTNPDEPNNYRADDREGCLDGVFSEADRALTYIRALTVFPEPRP